MRGRVQTGLHDEEEEEAEIRDAAKEPLWLLLTPAQEPAQEEPEGQDGRSGIDRPIGRANHPITSIVTKVPLVPMVSTCRYSHLNLLSPSSSPIAFAIESRTPLNALGRLSSSRSRWRKDTIVTTIERRLHRFLRAGWLSSSACTGSGCSLGLGSPTTIPLALKCVGSCLMILSRSSFGMSSHFIWQGVLP